jgi:rod shape-determining protein MreD
MGKHSKKYKWLLTFISTKLAFLSSFIILLLSFVNLGFPEAKPMFVLIPIFFWSMMKVKSFDFIYVLFFGFIQDFIDGTTFGLNIFIFLSLYFMVFYQKFFPLDSSFVFSYLAFSIVSFILMLVKYFIILTLFIPTINFFNVLLSWAVLILFYPLFYWILNWLYIKLVGKYQ